MKGRALRRALATRDVIRVNTTVPLITDTTELITPEVAHEMLQRNKRNRPINWHKVEEYADQMKRGEWGLHAQGIILDVDDNILTGQKRLWAVIYSGVNVYMRVSRGNPSESARLIDRGTPQSARDLASRETGRRHSPHEVSIARTAYALLGIIRPNTDEIATKVETAEARVGMLLAETRQVKKTREVLMMLSALAQCCTDQEARTGASRIEMLAAMLKAALAPYTPDQVWNRGAAFGMAMGKAKQILVAQGLTGA
jgi:hypothetical protein